MHPLSVLFLIIPTLALENSPEICSRCSCRETPDFSNIVLDCSRRNFSEILSQWPVHNSTTIITTFAENNIATLKPLPSTDAALELVLNKCNIRFLSPGLFVNTKNIKFLDLSYNKLTADEISSEKFKGPYNETFFEPLGLENLNLAYNQIHSLSKNVFEHLPNLKILNLEGNDFTVLDVHTQLALSSIVGLQSLNLANNELTELAQSAIERSTNLRELDLSRNQLDFVPESLVHVGNSLEILILDGNPILEFVDETFIGLENVNELSANNLDKLKYINAETFVPMLKLKKLSLCNNSILIDIDREAFGINQTLEELYLNNNALYRIDFKLLPWSRLQIFEFKNNPLECSCDLYNITTTLPSDITRNEDGPSCKDPRSDRWFQVFYLKSDICLVKKHSLLQKHYINYHFTMVKMTLVILSFILMMAAFFAALVAYLRYKKYQRNQHYPYASQILYNPLTTNGRF